VKADAGRVPASVARNDPVGRHASSKPFNMLISVPITFAPFCRQTLRTSTDTGTRRLINYRMMFRWESGQESYDRQDRLAEILD
jgi:hypothetical protein